MKQSVLAMVGALALTWQTGTAAGPISADDLGPTQPMAAGAAVAPTSTHDAACGEPSCCNPCCDSCDQGGRLIGGLGLYVIQPFFENNPAYTVTAESSTGTVVEQTDRTDIHHSMSISPELWLGYLGENGLGVRLRWWYFRQGTDQSLSFAPGTAANRILVESAGPLGITAFVDNEGQAATMAVTSKLQLQVWDFEGLHHRQTAGWDLLLTGGVRAAHINQHYNAYTRGDSGGEDVETGISVELTSGHSFHGVGPTVSLEARHPLGDSGLAFFGKVRGALLFGSAKQNALDAFTPDGEDTEFAYAEDHRTRVMPVGEMELGVEYARTMGAGRAFGQVALVGQDWLGAGNASRSTQNNFLGIPDGASIIDNDLGFFGFLFRAGVNY